MDLLRVYEELIVFRCVAAWNAVTPLWAWSEQILLALHSYSYGNEWAYVYMTNFPCFPLVSYNCVHISMLMFPSGLQCSPFRPCISFMVNKSFVLPLLCSSCHNYLWYSTVFTCKSVIRITTWTCRNCCTATNHSSSYLAKRNCRC